MTAYRTNNSLSVGFQDRNSQPDARKMVEILREA